MTESQSGSKRGDRHFLLLLADLHFRGSDTEEDEWSYLVSAARLSLIQHAWEGARAAGILVAGDCLWKAQFSCWPAFSTGLNSLAAAVGCSPSDCVLVPGNHDLVVPRRGEVSRLESLRSLIDEDADFALEQPRLWQELRHDAAKELARKRIAAYSDSLKTSFPHLHDGILPHCEHFASFYYELPLSSPFSIITLGLNNVWSYEIGINPRASLPLGGDQWTLLRSRLMELQPQHRPFVCVILHAPFECLPEAERVLLGRRISQVASLVISGHRHTVDPCGVSNGCLFLNLGSASEPQKNQARVFVWLQVRDGGKTWEVSVFPYVTQPDCQGYDEFTLDFSANILSLPKKHLQPVVFRQDQKEASVDVIQVDNENDQDTSKIDRAKIDSHEDVILTTDHARMDTAQSELCRAVMVIIRAHPNGIGYDTLRSRVPESLWHLLGPVLTHLEQAGQIRLQGRVVHRGGDYHEQPY